MPRRPCTAIYLSARKQELTNNMECQLQLCHVISPVKQLLFIISVTDKDTRYQEAKVTASAN